MQNALAALTRHVFWYAEMQKYICRHIFSAPDGQTYKKNTEYTRMKETLS